jgi:hypothetical protein
MQYVVLQAKKESGNWKQIKVNIYIIKEKLRGP